jgi:oligopeptide transport system permease protein
VSRGLRRFAHDRTALAAAVALVATIAACVVWPAVSGWDPNAVDFSIRLQGPSGEHPLGTDAFGRDLLSRMTEGGRYSLTIAAGAALLVLVAGFLYGGVAGLVGGRVDSALMRLLDGLFALPRLPFWLVILSLVELGADVWILIVALASVSWLTTARLVRGQVVHLRKLDFVRAAEAIGAGRGRILLRHVGPNVLGVLLVAVLLEVPAILLGEAFVSVLGLGVSPPQATWGTIAQDGQTFGRLYEILLPSLAIVGFAVCIHLVVDGVQDALDPRRESHRAPGVVRRALGGLASTVRRAAVGR